VNNANDPTEHLDTATPKTQSPCLSLRTAYSLCVELISQPTGKGAGIS
jgi:hypothetical protein